MIYVNIAVLGNFDIYVTRITLYFELGLVFFLTCLLKINALRLHNKCDNGFCDEMMYFIYFANKTHKRLLFNNC